MTGVLSEPFVGSPPQKDSPQPPHNQEGNPPGSGQENLGDDLGNVKETITHEK